jgi:hypothetical protein
MKKLLLSTLFAVAAVSISCAQQSPRVTAEGKDVKVAYGQPSKKGREIFGGLVPYNAVWRAGANESTQITFAKDTKFGGKTIKAGTYALFINPAATEWTIILNSVAKQPGAFDYEKNKDKDVLSVKVPVKKTDAVVEKLTYRFDAKNALIIEWDQTQVAVPIG